MKWIGTWKPLKDSRFYCSESLQQRRHYSDDTVSMILQQCYCSNIRLIPSILLHKSGPRPQVWHNENSDLSSPIAATLRRIFHHLIYANQWHRSFLMTNIATAKTLGSTSYQVKQRTTHSMSNNDFSPYLFFSSKRWTSFQKK